jgi:hypothetical protein
VVLVIILTVGEKHWSMTWRNITVIVTLVVDDIDVRIFGEIRRVEIRGEGVFVVAHKGRVETRKDVSLCEGFWIRIPGIIAAPDWWNVIEAISSIMEAYFKG